MRKSLIAAALIAVWIVIGCYEKEQAAPIIDEAVDVINQHGVNVKNRGKLDAFIDQTEGMQRIVHYTIEGDPVFHELNHIGDRIELRYDNTWDREGNQQVTTRMCSELKRVETDTYLSYALTGCDGERSEVEILRMEYELRPKVTFDLELRFGVNQRNEISTKERTVVKDLQNGETAVIRDFEFTDKERQSIYKALVLADYQEDKSLTTACNKEPHESFDLTVKVANGSYHYAWSECDKSEDGKRMTMLVEDIVGTLEELEEYKRLPAVQGYYE
ncbi:DUF4362 domain-containing protein [Paenibacillus lautus]|uniref:DUF4362 domain-containing protein n=1 Tax=Paenibacillus lautus TaxID=1401 RepID=UPI000FD79C1E|nr:DUF4362 domain-containing protein [Paenibacillus lautus]